ncbi:putative protein kinase RLK-Pelle-LRR-XII-1 family [Helianthus annuus]|nr:putative protein kinase RLK-Pelle-LRR-XII-1 family [Helianthus annuus]
MSKQFIKVSYNQLLKATNGFSEANLIGNGGFSSITNILTDIAYALDYLHNHCIPTIVHGDLKPSNILLDEDMVAHVGDFGLAQLFGNSYQNSSIGITGTIGYVAPEYGLGSEMTSSGDVYSFGILILEVMTGKKPTDDIFDEGLNLHKFASMALPDHVTNVVDGNFLKVCQKDEFAMQN